MYFILKRITGKGNHYKFISLFIVDDIATYCNTQNYNTNAIWSSLKADLLRYFKPVDYDRWNRKVLD